MAGGPSPPRSFLVDHRGLIYLPEVPNGGLFAVTSATGIGAIAVATRLRHRACDPFWHLRRSISLPAAFPGLLRGPLIPARGLSE